MCRALCFLLVTAADCYSCFIPCICCCYRCRLLQLFYSVHLLLLQLLHSVHFVIVTADLFCCCCSCRSWRWCCCRCSFRCVTAFRTGYSILPNLLASLGEFFQDSEHKKDIKMTSYWHHVRWFDVSSSRMVSICCRFDTGVDTGQESPALRAHDNDVPHHAG